MKKKGFTLIELLAVVIILGIISLIAVPTVSKIVTQSKKKAFEVTTNNVVQAIEDACLMRELENKQATIKYTFANGVVSPSLDVKGKLPTTGTATVNLDCKVTINVTNGKFTATKTSAKNNVTIVDGLVEPTVYANGTAVYFNPETGTKCTAGEAVSTTGTKTGCMKWYTFNDGGASSYEINLILDHNTTARLAFSIGNNVSGPTEVMTQLQTDTSTWTGVPTRSDSYSLNNGTATYTINYSTYKARLISAAEIAAITGNSSFVEANAPYTSWFYLDSNNQTSTATTAGASKYAWLFDNTKDCTSYGCNIADAGTGAYWTSTASFDNTGSAWMIVCTGYLRPGGISIISGGRGVRPVITISKSILE